MTWASKRQALYASIVFFFVAIFLAWIIYPYFNKAPTCTDGVKNGTETGVDCGGGCALACIYQVDQISILWSRAFKVVDGRYNAVAYLENHNANSVIQRIHYRFRFADKDNIYIGKREGDTFVPAGQKFSVFEPAIDTGNSVPVYTTFEFTEIPTWIQVSKEKLDQLKLVFSDINLTNEKTSPKLSAQIKNNSLFRIPNVSIVAILYDIKGNAVNISKTFLDELKKEEKQSIGFTWPSAFSAPIISKELIPIYNIFDVKLD